MPRFYFHVYEETPIIDDDGTDLPDLAAVRGTAIQIAREVLAEEVLESRIKLGHGIEVEDEERRPVLTLPFRSVVTIED